jgi:hypothetical protein
MLVYQRASYCIPWKNEESFPANIAGQILHMCHTFIHVSGTVPQPLLSSMDATSRRRTKVGFDIQTPFIQPTNNVVIGN